MEKINKGEKYKVLGTTDNPVCDCCGKTNLTRAVGLESESGEILNVGVICASKLLRQSYMGKTHKVSADAVLSIGKRVKREGGTTYLTAA
jgi:hypothetical protein